MRGHAFRISLVLIAGVAAPRTGDAFSTQGQRWLTASDDTPVPYMVDPAGSQDAGADATVAAVRSAFSAWGAVACSYLRFEEAAFTPAEPNGRRNVVANDGANRVFWAEAEAEWPGDPGTLALTYTFYTLDDRQAITDADIVMNGASWTWTTDEAAAGQGDPAQVDVETVVFHEIGHFFGLAHSQDPDAAMYASNNKVVQRTPADDDVEGICALYSNGQPLPHNPEAGSGGPVGAPCLAHGNCASSLCVNDRAYEESYCSQACSPGAAGECPSGFECVPSTGNRAFCLRPQPIDEICDQCNVHDHCASGLCVTVPFRNGGAPFCTKPCDPTPGQPAQCPDGFQCEITQQQTTQIAVCVPSGGVCSPRGRGGHLEPCFGNGSCKPGHGCFEYWPGSGVTFCYALCDIRAAGRSCGTQRSICTPVPGRMNTAFCAEVARAGEPCLPEQCDSRSICAFSEAEGMDAALCYGVCPNGLAEECPANHDCIDAGLAAPVCIPLAGFRSEGESCQDNAECESGICRVIGDARLCTSNCSTTEADACGPGLVCVPPTGSTQGLCWPRSLSDELRADQERAPTPLPDYCACDITSACDADCDCDPECSGGCRHAAATPASTPRWGVGLAVLGAAGLWARRRRSFSSGRGRRRSAGSGGTG